MYLRVYRDDAGYPRAKAEAGYELVEWYLMSDVQSDVDWCIELLGIVERVERGEEGPWEGTGNAFTLILSPDRVRIESYFGDPPEQCELSYADLKQALREWLRVIAQPRTE